MYKKPCLYLLQRAWVVRAHTCVGARETPTPFFPLTKLSPVRNHSCHKLLKLNAIIKWVLPAKWSDWSNKHSNCTLWARKDSAMLYDPWALWIYEKKKKDEMAAQLTRSIQPLANYRFCLSSTLLKVLKETFSDFFCFFSYGHCFKDAIFKSTCNGRWSKQLCIINSPAGSATLCLSSFKGKTGLEFRLQHGRNPPFALCMWTSAAAEQERRGATCICCHFYFIAEQKIRLKMQSDSHNGIYFEISRYSCTFSFFFSMWPIYTW